MFFEKKTDKIFKALSLFTRDTPPVMLCIGSDRVTGDCFGPLTGDLLTRRYNINTFVYGTLNAPVTALNLLQTVAFIKARHARRPIFAVDSALGVKNEIGCFRVFPGGLKPGAAAGKDLPAVGDFSLTATVAEFGGSDISAVRLGFVTELAASAALEIARFFLRFNSVSATS